MSFVEKALNRLKRQEQEMAPLGEFVGRVDAEESPGGEITELVPGPASSARNGSRGSGRVISVDRDRLREEGFLAPEKYHRQMADEYRRIKRPLIANAFGIGVPQIEYGNLLLVSSAVAGEGKTHTCINLALSLAAERDRTVLLVDADVPKPHVSRLFGVADQPGLLDCLGDGGPRLEALIIRTDIPRLSVLPAGQWKQDATELLASGRMRELCDELARRDPDRIVLFDSPPLLAATEGQAISAVVGQVVLVIAENLTARDDVRSALGLLDDQKPINAILNKSRRPTLGGYYYGGYGYGTHGDTESKLVEVDTQSGAR